MNAKIVLETYQKELNIIYDSSEIDAIFRLAFEHLGFQNVNQIQNLIISKDQVLFLNNCLFRLKQNEPIQHIIQKAFFYKSWFKVNKNVLIPRSETEELVDIIIKRNLSCTNFFEIGIGSGCIALSLLRENLNWNAIGLDISSKALNVALENAISINVENRVTFINKSIFDPISLNKIDFIVSNPPYIALPEANLMHKNVLDFEPHIALFSEDPLAFYKRIAEISNSFEKAIPCYLEINPLYANQILSMFKEHILVEDMQKKMRFLIPQKPHL